MMRSQSEHTPQYSLRAQYLYSFKLYILLFTLLSVNPFLYVYYFCLVIFICFLNKIIVSYSFYRNTLFIPD